MFKLLPLLESFPKKFGVSRIKDFYLVLIAYVFFAIARNLYITFTNLALHVSDCFDTTLTSVSTSTDLLGSLVILPFFPLLARRFSFRIILISSSILLTLCSVLFIFFLTSKFSFVLRFGMGLAAGLFYTAISCYFAILFDGPHRALLFSFSYIILNLSFSIGASLMALFPSATPVYCITAFSFVLTIPLLSTLSTSPSMASPEGLSRKEMSKFWSVFTLIPSLFLFSFLTGLIFFWQGQYFTIFSVGIGLLDSQAGWLYSFSLLGTVLAFPLSSFFADSYGFRIVFCVLCLIGSALSLLSLLTTSPLLLGLLFFFITPITATLICLVTPWVAQVFSTPHSLSVAMSLRSIFLRVGGLLSPLLIGFCIEKYGPYSFVYLLSFGFFVGALILGSFWRFYRSPSKATL